MLNLGLIGIGNAGNQVANLAAGRGIESYCINTSKKDLECLGNTISTYLLGSNEGAGKDRNTVKALIKEQYKDLITADGFEVFSQPLDVCFIVSSTGGGSGSGASIILADILSKVYPNKIFINIGILPDINESLASQRNSLEYLKELKKLGKGYMLYDNNKYNTLSPSECLEKVNTDIVDMITYIRGDYNFKSPYGMIDDADVIKLLSINGMMNFSEVHDFYEKDLNEENIDSLIVNAIKVNSTCLLDRDRIVKRMGVVVNINEALVKYYDPFYKKLKETFGEALEVYEHYFIIDKTDDSQYENRIGVLMTGLSIPDDRIGMIISRIEELEKILDMKKEKSVLDDVVNIDSFRLEENKLDRSKKSMKNENLEIDLSDY